MDKNYVARVRSLLVEELGEEYKCEDDLVDLYTLLVLILGPGCTLMAVHDAWSVWRNNTNPEHKSIVHFFELSPEIQAYDEPYRAAIVRAAGRMFSEGALIDG